MDRQTEVATYSTIRILPYRLVTDESTSASSSPISEKTKPYWDTPGSQPCNQKSIGKGVGLITPNYPSYSEPQTLERVFSEEASHEFPPSRPWDHAMDLKPGAPAALPGKLIPLSQAELEQL